MSDAAAQPQQEVARFFTRIRRIPAMIGVLPGGVPIPFGPFKLGAVGAGAAVAVALYQTRVLWSPEPALLGYAIIAVLAVAVIFGANALPSVGRNPFLWLVGTTNLVTGAAAGTRDGRPLTINEPYQVHHRIAILSASGTVDEPPEIAADAPAKENASEPATFDALVLGNAAPNQRDQRLTPSLPHPPRPPQDRTPITLTGVGRLLAAATTAGKETTDAS